MKQLPHIIVAAGIMLLAACGEDTSSSVSPAAKPVVSLSPLMRGKSTYSRCKACHTLEQGGKNLVGPNLYGVMGRTAGTREDFIYSKAMMNSGLVWSDEELMAYLENPLKYIPGNRMAFAGLREESTRKNLILYLRSETDPEFVMKPEYNQPQPPASAPAIKAPSNETETP